MVYVFNVAGIGSSTVKLGNTTEAIRLNHRPHLCVLHGHVCVYASNSLINYLWSNHGSFISQYTSTHTHRFIIGQWSPQHNDRVR